MRTDLSSEWTTGSMGIDIVKTPFTSVPGKNRELLFSEVLWKFKDLIKSFHKYA